MNTQLYTQATTEYNDLRFVNESLSGIEINQVYFEGCEFDSCDFSESFLVDCSFSNCIFTNCNLLLVKIPNTNFNTARFDRCDMIGIDWTAARWFRNTKKAKQTFPILFRSCRLNHSVFVGMNIANAIFTDCVIKEVFFEDASMENCSFDVCDLDQSIFKNTNLRGADFSTARNYNIDACQNNITKAKFSLPEAISLIYSLDIKITNKE